MAVATAGCGGEPVVEARRTVPYSRPSAPAVAAEGVRVGEPLLVYRSSRPPCGLMEAGSEGLAFGRCGEKLSPRVYASTEQPLRLAVLVARHAPFEHVVGDEEVELHGQGTVPADPVLRRMVLEWARRLAAQAQGLTASRTYRLAFDWQLQESDGVGGCRGLAVYLSGEAVATTCAGERSSGVLAPEEMARVFDWYESLEPTQAIRREEGGNGGASTRLIVPGAGQAEAGPTVVASFGALAAGLHQRLLAEERERRRASAEPMPEPAAPAIARGPGAPELAAAPAAPQPASPAAAGGGDAEAPPLAPADGASAMPAESAGEAPAATPDGVQDGTGQPPAAGPEEGPAESPAEVPPPARTGEEEGEAEGDGEAEEAGDADEEPPAVPPLRRPRPAAEGLR
jgi:hypothetical protein